MWRVFLVHEGVLIVHGFSRLTNIRYADDILLYAISLDERISMTEKLTEELQKIGLIPSLKKTNIRRCNPMFDKATMNVTELDEDFVKVLDDNESHRYLGNNFSISSSDRNIIEIKCRKQAAWIAFGKHMNLLLDRNISLQLRLK